MKALYIFLGGVVGFIVIPGIFLLVISYILYREPTASMYMVARIMSIWGFIIGIYMVGSAIDNKPQ